MYLSLWWQEDKDGAKQTNMLHNCYLLDHSGASDLVVSALNVHQVSLNIIGRLIKKTDMEPKIGRIPRTLVFPILSDSDWILMLIFSE